MVLSRKMKNRAAMSQVNVIQDAEPLEGVEGAVNGGRIDRWETTLDGLGEFVGSKVASGVSDGLSNGLAGKSSTTAIGCELVN